MSECLPRYYTILFNAVTDAIRLLAEEKAENAKALLIAAQQNAEEIYLSES